MKRTVLLICSLFILFICVAPPIVEAKKVKKEGSEKVSLEGDRFFETGRFEEAAKWYVNFVRENHNKSKETPAALIKTGHSLDNIVDGFNTAAERVCFRSGNSSNGAACMHKYAENLNSIYGAGSFEYSEQMIVIRYLGRHYKKVVDEFPDSEFAPEAAYLLLLKNLIGHPDEVLPRIKEYMDKYKTGPWGRRGRLLWARVNEDIWWIHRKWSWVIYNWQLSPEELIVKAEPYRQEALETFDELIKKDGSSEEGKIAKQERELLKKYQDDGRLYGIVNESSMGGVLTKP